MFSTAIAVILSIAAANVQAGVAYGDYSQVSHVSSSTTTSCTTTTTTTTSSCTTHSTSATVLTSSFHAPTMDTTSHSDTTTSHSSTTTSSATPTTTTSTTTSTTQATCVDFVTLKDQTVYASTFSSVGSSDVQGNVAVSGDVTIGSNYQIAGELKYGGQLNWPGLNQDGSAGKVTQGQFDFSAATREMETLSASFLLNSQSGITAVKTDQAGLKSEAQKASSVTIFNVAGGDIYVGNDDYLFTCDAGKTFVYNFYEASKIKVENLKMCGIVLAPKADFHGNNGLFEGHIFVKTFKDDKNFQINDRNVSLCVENTGSTFADANAESDAQQLQQNEADYFSAASKVSSAAAAVLSLAAFILA